MAMAGTPPQRWLITHKGRRKGNTTSRSLGIPPTLITGKLSPSKLHGTRVASSKKAPFAHSSLSIEVKLHISSPSYSSSSSAVLAFSLCFLPPPDADFMLEICSAFFTLKRREFVTKHLFFLKDVIMFLYIEEVSYQQDFFFVTTIFVLSFQIIYFFAEDSFIL